MGTGSILRVVVSWMEAHACEARRSLRIVEMGFSSLRQVRMRSCLLATA